jgi:biotin-dependent carboxylase-like uncharacterized protein
MEYVTVLKPGLLTTVQDLGRKAYRGYGVSVSGVMDPLSFRLGNILVGNPENTAALEATLVGPTLRFNSPSAIAITGGNFSPELNGVNVPMWSVIRVDAGDELQFGKYQDGSRVYIAFAGGIDVPKVMGSRATYLRGSYGGFHGRALEKGDKIPLGKHLFELRNVERRRVRTHDIPNFKRNRTVRFIVGPHLNEFKEASLHHFLTKDYTISNTSDRMGFRLEGNTLEHKNGADILSDFITPGTIQVPGNGQPIIHMADCGTSGGYTKLGVITVNDLPYVAQKKPGDKLHFTKVSIEDAQNELIETEGFIKSLSLNNEILN